MTFGHVGDSNALTDNICYFISKVSISYDRYINDHEVEKKCKTNGQDAFGIQNILLLLAVKVGFGIFNCHLFRVSCVMVFTRVIVRTSVCEEINEL